MASTPIVRHHPSLSPEDRHRTLPLGLHGDEGSFSKQDSLFVFTFNSLLCDGATMAKRFVMAIIKKSDMVPGTLDKMMAILSWSFNVALAGLSPQISFDGEAIEDPTYLAGRWRGSLIQVRCGWEFYKTIFNFPAWNAAEQMCWLCRASGRGELRFSACGADAAWRRTRQTHEMYVADIAAAGQELPILLDRVHGLRLESVMIDVLHTVDLGIAAHIAGNIFWLCVQKDVWPGGTQDERVAGLEEELNQHYTDTNEKSRLMGAPDDCSLAH